MPGTGYLIAAAAHTHTHTTAAAKLPQHSRAQTVIATAVALITTA